MAVIAGFEWQLTCFHENITDFEDLAIINAHNTAFSIESE
jgi:hypothetical protein